MNAGENKTESDRMVTYIDAASAPLKNTGVIRLYNSQDFEGMRKASQLTEIGRASCRERV